MRILNHFNKTLATLDLQEEFLANLKAIGFEPSGKLITKEGLFITNASPLSIENKYNLEPMIHLALTNAFQRVKKQYGAAFAKNLEQLYAKETRYFDSKQFKLCFSPGMEAVNKHRAIFPYGWSSLREFSEATGLVASDFKIVKMNENGTGINKPFIAFPTVESAVMFTAFMVHKRKRFGYWRSLNDDTAARYERSMMSFVTLYTTNY